jgi:hypothetical protein
MVGLKIFLHLKVMENGNRKIKLISHDKKEFLPQGIH